MRVIDGMHRVYAAVLRGASHIEAEFFDGTEDEAFVVAVRENATHGLPLTSSDRNSAAARILSSHPQWSDRRIAGATGLSRRAVGELRKRATGHVSQLHDRIGLDGRVRPLSSTEGRRRAGEFVRQRPDASLREIARATGVSVGTARDVRTRIQRGDDPVPAGRARTGSIPAEPAETFEQAQTERTSALDTKDYVALWNGLVRDPSLRLAESGRRLLRRLGGCVVGLGDQSEFAATVPLHCAGAVAELARHNARMWEQFAEELERRGTELRQSG